MKHLPILTRGELIAEEHKSAGTKARCKARYTARWLEGGIIYRNQRSGNLIGMLPRCWPDFRDNPGTLLRTDGGDPFECAYFVSHSGRRIEVRREERSP